MLRFSTLRRCITNKISAAGTSEGLLSCSEKSELSVSVKGPVSVIASNFGIGERTVDALAAAEEERRVARWGKLYDDMIVFEGGAIADNDFVGKDMIMRDYVHFALYHSKWGYYPKLHRKYREQMTSGFFDPVPFATLRNQQDYQDYASRIHSSTPSFVTPSQLFQPFYGWVIAEYLVSVYRAKFHPSEPLVIYDVGAGTGALAVAFLNFLAEHYPEMYDKVEYHVIEQSGFMIPLLRTKLIHHYHRTKIHHISILNWRQRDPRRCVVLGIELLSGLPHDLIYWSNTNEVAEQWWQFYQGDNLATAMETFNPVKDPVILRYLRCSQMMQEESLKNLKILSLTGGQEVVDPGTKNHICFDFYQENFVTLGQKILNVHNPFRQMYIPTAAMMMIETIAEHFPRHHCFFADWSEVQYGIAGFNGPLVQVKIRIAKDSYVRRSSDTFSTNAGMVDLCFPTDFSALQTVYKAICGDHKEVSNMTHPQFWRSFGGDKIALFASRSGYNPILEDFKMFQVFAAHHPAEL